LFFKFPLEVSRGNFIYMLLVPMLRHGTQKAGKWLQRRSSIHHPKSIVTSFFNKNLAGAGRPARIEMV
jgi:hypothetical protein